MIMNYLKQTSTCTAQQSHSNYSVLQMSNVLLSNSSMLFLAVSMTYITRTNTSGLKVLPTLTLKAYFFCYQHVNGTILLCKMPQWTAYSIIDTVLNFSLPYLLHRRSCRQSIIHQREEWCLAMRKTSNLLGNIKWRTWKCLFLLTVL